MKRHLVSAVVVVMAATGCVRAKPPAMTAVRTPVVCPGPDCVRCETGCKINVAMQTENGECKAKGVTEVHKIKHIIHDQQAQWIFRNDCPTAMDLGVGYFGLHPEETCPDIQNHSTHKKEWKTGDVDKDPFVQGPRSVRVAPGQTGNLTLTLIHTPKSPRTYKYAITVNGKPRLDPEIEIER